MTKNQTLIFSLLQELKEPISAQEVHRKLHDRGQFIGLATVYRSLDTLKLMGTIKSASAPNGESLYSIIPIDRHHLHCLSCGVSLAINMCPLQGIAAQLKSSYEFNIYYHTLEFFGICRTCQLSKAK